jgi:hypothetical protein
MGVRGALGGAPGQGARERRLDAPASGDAED